MQTAIESVCWKSPAKLKIFCDRNDSRSMCYPWLSFHSLDYTAHHWKIKSIHLCFTDGDKQPLSRMSISAFLPQMNCAQILTPA